MRALAAALSALLAGAAAAALAAQSLPPEVEAALQRARVPAEALAVSCRRPAAAAACWRWQRARAGEPGLADEAADHLRRARPARPGLDLDHAGLAARHRAATACSTASWSSRAAATRSWCSNGCGCCCAACSSSACARSAATSCSTAAPSRRPRPTPADFDGEPTAALQRAARRAAAELQVGDLQLRARRRRAAWPGWSPTRRWRARTVDRTRAAGRRPLRRLARRAEGRFAEPTRLRFAGSYPAACGEQTWPVADADAGQLQRAPDRGAVARHGRPADRHACATARAPADAPAELRASVRRRWPRWCATSTSSATT